MGDWSFDAGFLGFDLSAWLLDRKSDELFALFSILRAKKQISWPMMRAIASAAGKSDEFRKLLSADDRIQYTDALKSLNKCREEMALWRRGVGYVFMRTIKRLARDGYTAKLPCLRPVAELAYRELERDAGPTLTAAVFRGLATGGKAAHRCYSDVGSHAVACAMKGLPDETVTRILASGASDGFVKDVLSLKNGRFLPASQSAVLSARDKLADAWFRASLERKPDPVAVVHGVLDLGAASAARCLFMANVLDAGMAIRGKPGAEEALERARQILPAPLMELMAASWDGGLKVWNSDPEAGTSLEIRRQRCLASSK